MTKSLIILIVDDCPSLTRTLTTALAKLQMEVVLASAQVMEPLTLPITGRDGFTKFYTPPQGKPAAQWKTESNGRYHGPRR